jgi:hypothetical protein
MGFTTTKVRSDFDEFASSREAYPGKEKYFPALVIQIIVAATTGYFTSKATLLLTFSLIDPNRTVDLRIKINGLLRLFCTPSVREMTDNVTIATILKHANPANPHCENGYTTIGKLKRNMFLYFTDVLDQFPQGGIPVHPDIWIYGHGDLIEKVGSAIAFPFFQADSEKYKAGGRTLGDVMEMITQRYATDRLRHRCWIHIRYQCMYCTWEYLWPSVRNAWYTEQFILIVRKRSRATAGVKNLISHS